MIERNHPVPPHPRILEVLKKFPVTGHKVLISNHVVAIVENSLVIWECELDPHNDYTFTFSKDSSADEKMTSLEHVLNDTRQDGRIIKRVTLIASDGLYAENYAEAKFAIVEMYPKSHHN